MNYVEQEWKSHLLKPRLVKESVFVQSLTRNELEMIRDAQAKGLKPGSFSLEGGTLILRFNRHDSGKPLREE